MEDTTKSLSRRQTRDASESIMERLQEDVSKIRETQAVQTNVLNSIMQQVAQSATLLTQYGTQIATLMTKVEVLNNDIISNRTEVNIKLSDITKWQNEAPNTFVPRKEHETLNLPDRVAALEKSQNSDRFSFLQWMIGNGVPIFLFLISLLYNIYQATHK